MTKTVRTWETVRFISSSKDGKKNVSIELTLNHQEKTFELSTDGDDRLIKFRGKDKEELDLKLDAIRAAVNYTKQNLK